MEYSPHLAGLACFEHARPDCGLPRGLVFWAFSATGYKAAALFRGSTCKPALGGLDNLA